MRIELLDEAESDLLNGFVFYERQEPGVGQYFLNSLFSDIDSLQVYAGVHSMYFGFYRLLSGRFPYAVYYRIFDDVVRVYAVLDCRQSTKRVTTRLAKRG